MSENRPAGELVQLRPIEEPELASLLRLLWDPEAPGEHQWFGFRMETAREIRRRWHQDGLIGEDTSLHWGQLRES